MKKVLLTKSKITSQPKGLVLPGVNSSNAMSASTNANIAGENNTCTYQQRKSMETAYKDLFKALFRIPDKQVLQRVVNAINGLEAETKVAATPQKCVHCSVKREKPIDVATQTDEPTAEGVADTDTADSKSKKEVEQNSQNSNTTSCEDPGDTPPLTPAQTLAEDAADAPKRKRRRRKICLPQVVKRSQAQQAHDCPQPKLKKHKPNDANTGDVLASGSLAQMRERSDSLGSIGSLQNLDILLDTDVISPEEHIRRVIKEEYVNSSSMEAGLLPIHKAILINELNWLKRQIFVWKEIKKTDLNELLTDNDEDCLQLAVSNNCYAAIIVLLLDSGLNVNCLDVHSNTVVHLALLNEVDVETFDPLIRKIDLSMLLKLNDDGYTPLHVAVRQNCFLLAERMLNVMDERLLGNTVFKRESSKKQTDFLKFYEGACKHLNARFAMAKIKRRLLEAGEMRSGSTAFFYALENRLEHFIYFLLAHLSDPRVPNHSGIDAKSFIGEFGKTLNLSLKIDKTMDKVIDLVK